MAVLAGPRAWGTTRPALGALVQQGHPLAKGLVFCGIDQANGVMFEHMQGTSRRLSGTATALHRGWSSPGGVAMEATQFTVANNNTGWFFGPNTGYMTPGAFTYAALAAEQSFNDSSYFISDDFNTGGRGRVLVDNAVGGQYQVGTGGGSTNLQVLNSGTVTTGQLNLYAGGSSASGQGMLWLNGRPVATGALAGSAATSGNLCVGCRPFPGAQGGLHGSVAVAMVWNRLLQPSEMAWLYDEPFAMFTAPGSPGMRYLPSIAAPPTGAAGVTIPHSKVGLSDPDLVAGVSNSITGG